LASAKELDEIKKERDSLKAELTKAKAALEKDAGKASTDLKKLTTEATKTKEEITKLQSENKTLKESLDKLKSAQGNSSGSILAVLFEFNLIRNGQEKPRGEKQDPSRIGGGQSPSFCFPKGHRREGEGRGQEK